MWGIVKKLPFKVSAKAARLIGRENVANADGAISELVKNTYDADASHCSICFLPRYRETPDRLTRSEYLWLAENYPNLRDAFCPAEGGIDGSQDASSGSAFEVSANTDEAQRKAVEMALAAMQDLWIIDDGDGMSPTAVEENWMVIGTNFKELNITSGGGRTRTGAKGIGRFALDRLGTECELFSIQQTEAKDGHSYLSWKVDWNAFDGPGKVLDQVEAELGLEQAPFRIAIDRLEQICQIYGLQNHALECFTKKQSGTAIKIGLLRDDWSETAQNRLFKFLGNLVPPASQRALNIQLLNANQPSAFGDIESHILEDFDYRVVAHVKNDASVSFEIYRNELDHTLLDPALFLREDMRHPHFNEASFASQPLKYDRSFRELWPGQKDDFYENLKQAGTWTFDLIFMKRTNPGKDDLQRYPYRNFQPGPRKTWLEEFGGIKIYRDNFAVRPYGEIGSRSYDWLGLGQRQSVNPAAVSRKGEWKVGPQNVAGTVEISRIENIKLDDQANREGIRDGIAFNSLRMIMMKVIEEFENDRSTIHYNLNELFKTLNKNAAAKSEGAEVAKRIKLKPESATPADALLLAKAYEAQSEENRELRDEQAMLRALATLGTVLVSFSHEMGQLQVTMGSRSASLADILSTYISTDDLFGVQAPFHPYSILDDWEKDDQKVRQWFSFALSTINADKRRRKWLNLEEHLQKLKKNWLGFLNPRKIDLNLSFPEFQSEILAYEIDLDSIFNNLILNSVEAFVDDLAAKQRQISIKVEERSSNEVCIRFEDNGPGLSPDIKDAASIFRFAVTTKMDRKGNPTGTGFGYCPPL
jgi:signal transduction histidine kinase